jgi:PKD repeat protein
MLRNLTLGLLALCLLPDTLRAQCDGCTPDNNCTIEPAFPTLCPLTPPDATAGEYYQNDFTFWLPPTFTEPGSGVTVSFQQMTITSVTGLPFGLSFTASTPSNVYYPQENAFGCGRICGTPLGAGEYLVNINIIASVTFSGLDIDAPQQFQLPLTVLPGTGGNSSFTYTPTTGCGSVTANFNALIDAAPSPTMYAWDFGNGNTSTAAVPSAQNYDTPGTYVISLQTSVGGYVLNTVNVTGVNGNWCGDVEEPNIPLVGCTGSPDLYFVLSDAGGNTYTSSSVDNTTTATWSSLGLLLDNPPYSVSFYDEDVVSGDDILGTYNIPANGEGTYFINVAGGTTGSLLIGLETQQVFTDTDTIVVFPTPAVVLQQSPGSGQLCAQPADLAGYVWFMDGDTVPNAAAACLNPSGPGVYQVVGTNALGCTGTSNTVVVCPTLTIERNGNVLFVPNSFTTYAWTFNGAAIGGHGHRCQWLCGHDHLRAQHRGHRRTVLLLPPRPLPQPQRWPLHRGGGRAGCWRGVPGSPRPFGTDRPPATHQYRTGPGERTTGPGHGPWDLCGAALRRHPPAHGTGRGALNLRTRCGVLAHERAGVAVALFGNKACPAHVARQEYHA